MDISSQNAEDIEDIEDDNGDRLINDFMCDILEEEDDVGEFDNDSRLNQVAESANIMADHRKHNTDPSLLDN